MRNASSFGRRGAVMVLMVVLMVLLISMVAFAVEVGRMYLVRAQLQTAVDAGALAANLQLQRSPDDTAGAVAAATDYIQRNSVGWIVTVPTDAITVETGRWDDLTRTFSTTGVPDSVRVSANPTNEPLLFANALGVSNFAVLRSAIANGGGNSLDIVMTLDLSGSMGGQGRIQALQNAAPEFLNVLEGVGDSDRVGVMGYGAIPNEYNPASRGHSGVSYLLAPSNLFPAGSEWVAVLESPLTHDLDYLRNNVLDTSTLTANKYNGWTPIGAALRDSAHYLDSNARPGVEKVIVLMSDGHANKPSGNGPGYARLMADYAASLNIDVYTISLGNAADETLMQDIANRTGGEHFLASGSPSGLSAALTEAFRNIAVSIKRTQLVQ